MSGEELTPEQKLRAETEHAECQRRWARIDKMYPNIGQTLHGIEAHFPPQHVIHMEGISKPDTDTFEDVVDAYDASDA